MAGSSFVSPREIIAIFGQSIDPVQWFQPGFRHLPRHFSFECHLSLRGRKSTWHVR
jgi:hypothetical protein